MNSEALAQLDWEKVDNLMPVIIQNAISGDVLMLGYMDKKALDVTLESGNVTFLFTYQTAFMDKRRNIRQFSQVSQYLS